MDVELCVRQDRLTRTTWTKDGQCGEGKRCPSSSLCAALGGEWFVDKGRRHAEVGRHDPRGQILGTIPVHEGAT